MLRMGHALCGILERFKDSKFALRGGAEFREVAEVASLGLQQHSEPFGFALYQTELPRFVSI